MLLHSSISFQIEQIAVKFKIAPRKHPDPDSDPKGRN